MKNVFILFFKILNVYKKKRLKILIYEIYFIIKYFKTGNLIKFRNLRKIDFLTDEVVDARRFSAFVF